MTSAETTRIGKLTQSKRALFGSPTAVHSMFTLADQIVVSGTRFLVMIVVARSCGEAVLGAFALVISIVYLTQMVQQTLVSTPYANFRLRPSKISEREYLRDVSQFAIIVSAFASLLALSLGGVVVLVSRMSSEHREVLLLLGHGFFGAALATPFLLLTEFARRVWLIRMQGRRAFVLSTSVGLGLIALVSVLLVQDRLTINSVFAAMAAVFGLATCVCFRLLLFDLRIDFESLAKTIRRHWAFGKYIFFSESLNYGRSNLLHWLITAFLGIGATGFYSACQSIMRVINPFYLAVAGVAEPTIAAGFALGGKAEVRRIAIKVLVFLIAGTLPLCIAVTYSSNFLLNVLYGPKFAEYSVVVVWLAAAGFLASISYPFSNAMQAVDRPDINYRIRVLTFALSLVGVIVAAQIWGLVGVAATHVLCSWIALTIRIYYFQRLTAAHGASP